MLLIIFLSYENIFLCFTFFFMVYSCCFLWLDIFVSFRLQIYVGSLKHAFTGVSYSFLYVTQTLKM